VGRFFTTFENLQEILDRFRIPANVCGRDSSGTRIVGQREHQEGTPEAWRWGATVWRENRGIKVDPMGITGFKAWPFGHLLRSPERVREVREVASEAYDAPGQSSSVALSMFLVINVAAPV
jgi:hypothetical protein